MPFGWRNDKQPEETRDDTFTEKKSKRQSLLGLFKSKKWMRNLQQDPIAEKVVPSIVSHKHSTVTTEEPHLAPEVANSETDVRVNEGKKVADSGLGSQQSQVVHDLSKEDVQSLFSGAPQFSVGQEHGQPKPAASFPWDFSLGVRDVADCPPLAHPAFSASTLRKHIARSGSSYDRDGSTVQYNIGVAELPNMLSAQGNEPGTVGFDYFLQESIADSLQVHQDVTDIDKDESDRLQNHALLQVNAERMGIRKFDMEHIVERLVELSEVYQDLRARKVNILDHQTASELYSGLFSQLLMPPKFDNTAQDPTGLKVQIESLIKSLKLNSIWYDFSQVEWRIRVGQTLWTDPSFQEEANCPDEANYLDDRNILLLQLVLACELLLRLEAIASLSTEEVNEKLHLTGEEIHSFRDLETRKTKWDLGFARRFLDNIEVRRITVAREQVKQPSSSSFAFFSSASPQLDHTTLQDQVDIMFLPRNPKQELSGLFHFAEMLCWPDAESVEKELIEALRANEDVLSIPSPSIYGTPLGSPASSYRNSGYFETRPQASRSVTARSLQLQPASPTLRPTKASPNGTPSDSSLLSAPKALIGGWLSRTCLSGLVLPGEAISHFLISALLENDATAITALGDSANLYSGFLYRGRSWWSKACILGRVLACSQGATECMGWISVPVVPAGFEDSWVDVRSTPVEPTGMARIEDADAVASDSSFLAGNELKDTKPGDFTLPQDSTELRNLSIRFRSLQLDLVRESNLVDVTTPSFSASLRFSSGSISDSFGLGHPLIKLDHLITFISAFPCTTPPAEKLQVLKGNRDAPSLGALPAHPLHISQTYRTVPATTILTTTYDLAIAIDKLSTEKSILIIDARGDTVLELASRAWCSSHGEHALISRVGVTCLACSVREARALAVKIVIRIG
ncbi:hypothetical protein EJ08DRAFT_605143 [Tothia fuscella]|uniref:Uncharacterized protein n=1 Tax=Tothia fuscella TaxID=1048955 RepID=A0A9P4NZL6_9PEZI|nr:hypothetical protein EJ08DRAFT_605143 [Tothia fuscella]